MMVFKNLSESLNVDLNETDYFKKYRYDESEKKVSVHLRIAPDIANDLVKVIAAYREFGIDKHELIKSELAAVIFKEFIDGLADDESALLDLFSKLKMFHDGLADDVSGGVTNGWIRN